MNSYLVSYRHFYRVAVCLTLVLIASVASGQPTAVVNQADQLSLDQRAFYSSNLVHSISLEIDKQAEESMNAALPERIYVPATFRLGNVRLTEVGVRFKGNSSSHPRQRYKRSFLIKFSKYKKEQRFLGLERISLDNGIQFGSLFSERLITPVLHKLDVKAPRCNYVRLSINGVDRGVYVNVERIDATFLQRNFGDENGALYKVDEGGAGGNLGGLPPNPGPEVLKRLAFESKSPNASKDAKDVQQLIRLIRETPNDQFEAVMRQTFETDAFLKTTAVMLFSGAFDQLTGWNAHNYYLYRHPKSQRWHYLPWDLDVGFADKAFGKIPVLEGWNAAWPVANGTDNPLLERIVRNPKLLARYRAFADQILEEHFHPNVITGELDKLYAQIKPALATDPFPHVRVTNPTDTDYDSIVASQKEFMRKRYRLARAQLDSPGQRPPKRPAQRQGKPRNQHEPQPGPAGKDAPTELKFFVNESSIQLRWNDNANGEMAHVVQRADGEESTNFRNLVGTPGGNFRMATDPTVVPGKVYRYRVYAVFPSPQGPRGSGVSNVVTVKFDRK